MNENFQEDEKYETFEVVLIKKNFVIVKNNAGYNVRIPSLVLMDNIALKKGDKINLKRKKGVFYYGNRNSK